MTKARDQCATLEPATSPNCSGVESIGIQGFLYLEQSHIHVGEKKPPIFALSEADSTGSGPREEGSLPHGTGTGNLV